MTIVEAFGDEQHGVGAGRSRFEHLVAIEDKILPQHRQADRLANTSEIVEVSLKIVLVR